MHIFIAFAAETIHNLIANLPLPSCYVRSSLVLVNDCFDCIYDISGLS